MNKEQIFLLSSKLLWRNFKKINDKLVHSGITPIGLDKVLWQMLRDKQLYLWLDLTQNDLMIGLDLPKNREVKVVTNFKMYDD